MTHLWSWCAKPIASGFVWASARLIGWMRADGGKIVRLEGSVTADVIERFVRQDLVPSLEPGDIVI